MRTVHLEKRLSKRCRKDRHRADDRARQIAPVVLRAASDNGNALWISGGTASRLGVTLFELQIAAGRIANLGQGELVRPAGAENVQLRLRNAGGAK